jgi:hypothetical protein
MQEKSYEDVTRAVSLCRTFDELFVIIADNAPFENPHTPCPFAWEAQELIKRIGIVRFDGCDMSIITRANGLREKVSELLLK